MFGRQDDVIKQDQKRAADVALPDSALAALISPPANASQTDNPEPASPPPPPSNTPFMSGPSIDGISAGPTSNNLASPFDLAEAHKRALSQTNQQDSQHPVAEDSTQQPNTTGPEPLEEPEELSYDTATEKPQSNLLHDEPSSEDTASYLSNLQSDNPDLARIKQSALEQLAPLVGQLKLSAEDKFKTTMMLIQASDNQTLIPVAYEAAQHIEDEQVRAQALLDVVNEINYFSKNSPATPVNE